MAPMAETVDCELPGTGLGEERSQWIDPSPDNGHGKRLRRQPLAPFGAPGPFSGLFSSLPDQRCGSGGDCVRVHPEQVLERRRIGNLCAG